MTLHATPARSAIVIGAGFGGLALAIRLQSAGIATVLLEARDKPGGRAYVWREEGHVFDAGPTVITDPDALRELWLGLAFQLTNIARDVIDDARIGRVYLPGDWLDEAGATVDGRVPSPRLHGVILRLLDAAEPYYASALTGLPHLPPRCAWSIASAARIYRAIGTRIRSGGPQAYSQRIGTSGRAKAGLALRAVADAGISRLAPRSVPRDGLWTRAKG